MRFHAPESDPLAGAAGLGSNHAGRPSSYDRLGVELWPTRELVRVMGGTLGVSTWADAHVTFTLELVRSLDRREPR